METPGTPKLEDESFPEYSSPEISSNSESEDVKKSSVPYSGLRRPFKSSIDINSMGSTSSKVLPDMKLKSKSHNELEKVGVWTGGVGRRGTGNYSHVPSKVKQYIASLPPPNNLPRRLVKQQTAPVFSNVVTPLQPLQEMTEKYERANVKLQEVINYNSELQRQIDQMQRELVKEKPSQPPPAMVIPSETIHLPPECDTQIRKRFVEPSSDVHSSVDNSQLGLVEQRRGKRQKIRKFIKKLTCCTGSDSFAISDGYMELPTARNHHDSTLSSSSLRQVS
ncbi:hypothetical protein DMENIID0001_153860 [Sergentomyia squamirostris]